MAWFKHPKARAGNVDLGGKRRSPIHGDGSFYVPGDHAAFKSFEERYEALSEGHVPQAAPPSAASVLEKKRLEHRRVLHEKRRARAALKERQVRRVAGDPVVALREYQDEGTAVEEQDPAVLADSTDKDTLVALAEGHGTRKTGAKVDIAKSLLAADVDVARELAGLESDSRDEEE